MELDPVVVTEKVVRSFVRGISGAVVSVRGCESTHPAALLGISRDTLYRKLGSEPAP